MSGYQTTLVKNNRFFRALVENSRGIIWLVDKDMRILFRSAYAPRLSGWLNDELTRVPMDRIHPDYVEHVSLVYAEALANPGKVVPLEFQMLHKEGWYICLEGTVTNLLGDPAVGGIVVNLHDITARKQAEDKLLVRSRLYHFMSRMNRAIVKADDEQTLFEEACRIAVSEGKFQLAWIGRVNDAGSMLVPVCYFGDESEYLSNVRIFLTGETPDAMGPGARAIRQGYHYVCNDIDTDPEMSPWRDAALRRNYKSSIGLPLVRGGKIVGLFALYADKKNFFDAEEITLLEALAADLSFALGVFEQRTLRMKMEEALNRINDGVISVDRGWRYTYLNDAALALHPMGREGALGRSVWDVHPQMRAMIFWEKYHEAMERRKVVEFEVRYDIPGTWFSIRAYPSEDGLTIYYKDITDRKKAESEQARVTEQLRELAAHLQDVREEERVEIARDIHDDLGQQLTAVKIELYRLSKQIAADDAAELGIQNAIDMLGKGIDSIRRISTQLRPVILDDLGLVEAIKWHIEEFGKRFAIPIVASFNAPAQEIEPKIAINVFRIYQEAVTNIARHSEATQAEVKLETNSERLWLQVADNGKGLNVDEIKSKRTLGLLGMKERALMIGGEFKIEAHPGRGTKIRIDVPIHKMTDANEDTHS